MSHNGRHVPAAARGSRRNRTIVLIVAIGLVAFGGGYLIARATGGEDPTVEASVTPSPTPSPTPEPTESESPEPSDEPPATDLEDGEHYIQATAAEANGDGDGDGDDLTFDLASFYTGEEAFEYAEEHDIALENEYLIVNDNPKLRTLPLASDASIEYIPSGTCCELQQGNVDAFVESVNGTNQMDYPDPSITWWWATIEDGVITGLVQQYLP
ncbi:MAG: hypothetical protein WD649_01395 [Thermoleophilaceae bacterium]